MPQIGPIAIAGAGIAGLTAALSLARKGFPVDIFERATHLSAVGAGLQLSANATRILEKLGLLPLLEAVWTEPRHIDLVDGRSLRVLASVPAGPSGRARWGSPYGVVSRASLQTILLQAIAAEPLCRLHLGAQLDTATPSRIAELTSRRPILVIGADGVHSAVRAGLPAAAKARFSGNLARRLLIPENKTSGLLDQSAVTAFVGRNCHLVAYPLRETQSFNLVAIAAGSAPSPSDGAQRAEAASKPFSHMLKGWSPDVRSLLVRADDLGVWPLYEVADGAWHNGVDTVLIGDAAHAMMPFAAQGAAMAIEDAFELSSFISDSGDIATALVAYADHRKPRVARVRARGAFNRFAYHASGPVRVARDFVLSLRSPEALAADLDWLYGYRARD